MVVIWLMMANNNLIGAIPTPLKNMKVSWDDYSQYIEKKKFEPTYQNMYTYAIYIYITCGYNHNL